MANRKIYANIIDQMLDDAKPELVEGVEEGMESAEALLNLTHGETDKEFAKSLKPVVARKLEMESSAPSIRYVQSDWRNQSNKALSDENVVTDALTTFDGAKSEGKVEEKEITEDAVLKYVKKLLDGGMPPFKVQAKLAAQIVNLYNKSLSQDQLVNEERPDTIPFLNTNDLNRSASLRNLLPIINKLTAGVPRERKLAALVRIASRERERAAVPTNVQKAIPTPLTVRSAGDMRVQRQATFTAQKVAKLHVAGHSIKQIYAFASKKAGSSQARTAIQDFVSKLKNSKLAVKLSQIDCTFLKQKLGVQNAIVGEKKCASCAYRQGMHCGLTGGTLLSFPGMNQVQSNHRIAKNAIKDGSQVLQEFDLIRTASDDIEFNTNKHASVELGPTDMIVE